MLHLLLSAHALIAEWDPLSSGDDTNCTAACTASSGKRSTTLPNVLLLSDSIGAPSSGYYTNVVAIHGIAHNVGNPRRVFGL